jgi:hypothetical protein
MFTYLGRELRKSARGWRDSVHTGESVFGIWKWLTSGPLSLRERVRVRGSGSGVSTFFISLSAVFN